MGIKIDDLNQKPLGADLLSGSESIMGSLRVLSEEELRISGGGGYYGKGSSSSGGKGKGHGRGKGSSSSGGKGKGHGRGKGSSSSGGGKGHGKYYH